eukprot:6490753-Amphidinium_carterae.1
MQRCLVTIRHSVASERVQCDHSAQYNQYVKHIQELPGQSVINPEQIPRIKQLYVTADNGAEHSHNQAMALHRWHRNNHMVLTNQLMAIRVNNAGNGTDLQWTSPVTIMHFSVTTTVEQEVK